MLLLDSTVRQKLYFKGEWSVSSLSHFPVSLPLGEQLKAQHLPSRLQMTMAICQSSKQGGFLEQHPLFNRFHLANFSNHLPASQGIHGFSQATSHQLVLRAYATGPKREGSSLTCYHCQDISDIL